MDDDSNLDVLIIEFFELYGTQFNYTDLAIITANEGNEGCYCLKKMKKSLKLTDEDLQQRVETEKDKLEWQDENIEFQRRERRERMKGGLESYADFM
ncbi:9903_t:CDS:2 [Entrophospora sp. SA101]|nr:9903_t:CDS:2 [Entrophospora sp. SA101]